MLQDFANITAMLGQLTVKHPLVRLAPFRPEFLRYFDGLLSQADEALTALNATSDQRKVLREKLLNGDGFFPAVTEVEALVHLRAANFALAIEPTYPLRGPDFLASAESFTCFVEVRSIGPEEWELGAELKFEYIRKKFEKVTSLYAAHFQVPDSYIAYSPQLKRAVTTAVRVLRELEQLGKAHATLYYFGEGDFHVSEQNLMLDPFALCWSEEQAEVQTRCLLPTTLSVDYQRIFSNPVSEGVAFGDDVRWLDPLSRIRGILNSKIKQLPGDARNVIILDISHANVRENQVEEALYGSARIDVLHSVDGHLLGIEQRRNNDGFFKTTTRIKAIVTVRRVIAGDSMDTIWTVFPTSNAASNDRLTRAEARRFGVLADGVESLLAEVNL